MALLVAFEASAGSTVAVVVLAQAVHALVPHGFLQAVFGDVPSLAAAEALDDPFALALLFLQDLVEVAGVLLPLHLLLLLLHRRDSLVLVFLPLLLPLVLLLPV